MTNRNNKAEGEGIMQSEKLMASCCRDGKGGGGGGGGGEC